MLQLENYELKRFWKLLFKKGILPPHRPLRKSLVWTMKARVIFGIAIFLHTCLLVLIGLMFYQKNFVSGIAYLVLWIIFSSLFLVHYSIALTLLWPVDFVAKQIIIIRAKSKIRKLDNLKVIGIAGSYGKTTMKEVLQAVLSAKFKLASTPESVNTPVGIGRWILSNFQSLTPSPVPPTGGTSSPSRGEENIEVAIVEMGEHYRGDIKYLCSITPPVIAVVTGINEAHLERMKTMDNIIATIFEIVDSSKPKALVILNGDDKNVIENYKRYVWPDHSIERFKIEDLKFKIFNQEELYWEAELDGIGKVKINLLGEYALGDVMAAVIIAKNLGMNGEEIKNGILNIKPIEHRLQPVQSANNILVIDDSYNGNPNGAREAIKVLSRFVNRRKIYVTPGLAETGKRAPEVHREIGRQLASVVDVVILIKNSVTPWIEEGILQIFSPQEMGRVPEGGERSNATENNQTSPLIPPQALGREIDAKPQIIYFNTAPEAHSSLSSILKANDVVLFQNDWGDQYV